MYNINSYFAECWPNKNAACCYAGVLPLGIDCKLLKQSIETMGF